jgi:arsenate reductase
MSDKSYNVLFLCTGNSARSILAEAIMNHMGQGKFHAYSAGSHPRGAVNPLAIATLVKDGYDVSNLRSKSWDEFAQASAPKMDFVFTVCDQAAGEACPIFPGHPISAHWGLSDPSHVEGDEAEKMKAFSVTKSQLANRIRLFLSLPIDKIEKMSLQQQLQDIGKQ